MRYKLNTTLRYIADALSENYDVDLQKARDIVATSFVAECYYDDDCRELIEHYDADYWAKEIMEVTTI